MLSLMKAWTGRIEVNGTVYDNVQTAISANSQLMGNVHIKLLAKAPTAEIVQNSVSVTKTAAKNQIRITVKQYMTKHSSPEFDFMEKWNHDNPMPLRTMTGTVEKETRGMVYMKLHGDIWAERICTCMRCGKQLTNPVSQYFGIGPECGGHNYINPFNSQEELKEAVASYRKELQNITWEGWVIKSAIISSEEADA